MEKEGRKRRHDRKDLKKLKKAKRARKVVKEEDMKLAMRTLLSIILSKGRIIRPGRKVSFISEQILGIFLSTNAISSSFGHFKQENS